MERRRCVVPAAYDAYECQELMPPSTCHARTVSPRRPGFSLPVGRRLSVHGPIKGSVQVPKGPLTSRVALARQHAIERAQTDGRTGQAKATVPGSWATHADVACRV